MPRSATTTDAFNAVAEPRRREILGFLASGVPGVSGSSGFMAGSGTGFSGFSVGEFPVNDIVEALGLAQPQVSKHLRVLREVQLVNVRGSGRRRLYSLNGENLKPIHNWVKTFERFWDRQLARIKERAESNARLKKK